MREWFQRARLGVDVYGSLQTIVSIGFVQAVIVPAIFAGAAAMSAWVRDNPIYLIILYAAGAYLLVVAAALVTNLLYRSTTPKHKLKITAVVPRVHVYGSLATKEMSLTGLSVSLMLRNDAEFPIKFIVEDHDLVIAKTVEPSAEYKNTGIELSGLSETEFAFHVVSFGTPIVLAEPTHDIDGVLSFSIRYGRLGRERIRIRRRMLLFFRVRLIQAAEGPQPDCQFQWRDTDYA